MLFRCGFLEIDPGAYRLSRHGMQVHLEPRAFELVAYLVANRDRVVSKDELIDRVWKGYPVSDSVLSGAIHKARQAVGDDSRAQELIKTVHRRGYQWVAPVEEIADSAPESASLDAPDDAETTVGCAQPSGLFTSRLFRFALAAGLPMLVLCGLLGFAVLRSSQPKAADNSAAAPVDEVVRIGLMPIASAGDQPAVRLATLSVSDLLALRLERQPSLVLRSPQFMESLQVDADKLADLAKAAEVDYLVSGSARVMQGVPRILITMELHHFEAPASIDSTPIGSYEVPLLNTDADLAAWVRLREAMATDIVAYVTPAVGLDDGSGSPPTDAEAFRLFLEARERVSRLSCGQGDAAIVLLERALELDPDFAMAWVVKADAYWAQAWICGRGSQFLQQALVQIERALSLDPALPEAILGKTLALVELGKVAEAYLYIRQARALAPRTPSVHFATAYALRYAGFLDAAEREMRKVIELDPLFFHEKVDVPLAALYQQRYEDFLRLLPGPSRPYHRFYRGFAELMRGQPERALALLQSGYAMDPNGYYGRASACLTAVLKGDVETASEIAGELARQRITLGTPDGEATYRVAQLLTLAGDHDEALVLLERAVAQGFFCAACFASDPLLAPLRDDPRYAATLAKARERHRRFGARFGLDEVSGQGGAPEPIRVGQPGAGSGQGRDAEQPAVQREGEYGPGSNADHHAQQVAGPLALRMDDAGGAVAAARGGEGDDGPQQEGAEQHHFVQQAVDQQVSQGPQFDGGNQRVTERGLEVVAGHPGGGDQHERQQGQQLVDVPQPRRRHVQQNRLLARLPEAPDNQRKADQGNQREQPLPGAFAKLYNPLLTPATGQRRQQVHAQKNHESGDQVTHGQLPG